MDLDEFIHNTLKNIISGIQDTNKDFEASNSDTCSFRLAQN